MASSVGPSARGSTGGVAGDIDRSPEFCKVRALRRTVGRAYRGKHDDEVPTAMSDPAALPYPFDPELAEFAALLYSMPEPADVAAQREVMATFIAMMPTPDLDGLEVSDQQVPGRDGDSAVPVRVYVPVGRTSPGPAILYLHGGGFTGGSLDSEHAIATAMARDLGVVLVSVDYRLAPEHPFPAAIEDCYTALAWLDAQADALGVDRSRVGVHGGSAGGGLAAALALLARDRGGPGLCFQFLGIPELDDRLETPSMQRFVDTPAWSRPMAVRSWADYLGAGEGPVSPYASPARATDLAGLPPAYVSVYEFDPLRDEGVEYASRLLAAGVSVEMHCFPGAFHGSTVVATAAVHQREAAEKLTVWRRALGLG